MQTAVVNARSVPLTLDAFIATLANSGVTTTTPLEINGLQCVNFTVQTDGVLTTCMVFPTANDSVVVFGFTPANVEPYTGLFRLMAASIMKTAD